MAIFSINRDTLGYLQHVKSAECPGLHLENGKVVGLGQAAVIKGETGAASANIQPLIHPQPKVTAGEKRRRKMLSKIQTADYDCFWTCKVTFLHQWQKSPNLLWWRKSFLQSSENTLKKHGQQRRSDVKLKKRTRNKGKKKNSP